MACVARCATRELDRAFLRLLSEFFFMGWGHKHRSAIAPDNVMFHDAGRIGKYTNRATASFVCRL